LDRETTSEILSTLKTPRSVSEIVSVVHRRITEVDGEVAEMERSGLVEKRLERCGVGRPRVVVSATPLGEEYLKRRTELDNIALRATPAALKRATADAEYASRLRARGLDPFQLFLELNEHVRSAAGTR